LLLALVGGALGLLPVMVECRALLAVNTAIYPSSVRMDRGQHRLAVIGVCAWSSLVTELFFFFSLWSISGASEFQGVWIFNSILKTAARGDRGSSRQLNKASGGI